MKILKNFEFNKISWFKVGGIIRKYITIDTTEELKQVLQENQKEKIIVIGNASNILMSDSGFDGILVKFGDNFKSIELVDNNKIKASSANLSVEVANFAMNAEFSNLEFLFTIPGCIGGNVFMNAGCYNNEIKDYLDEVSVLNKDTFKIEIIKRKDLNFEYRTSNLERNLIILSATFNCIQSEKDLIKKKMQEMNKKRLETQPIAVKTCGSTFKNTEIYSAWKLIEEVGLRNYTIGGACFSEKHSNFIINKGSATAKDIYSLIKLAQNKVFDKFNILLKPEIEFIGNFN